MGLHPVTLDREMAHLAMCGALSELRYPVPLRPGRLCPGDVLWVREPARVLDYRHGDGEIHIEYRADGLRDVVPWPDARPRVPPGAHVPWGCHREAARTYLRVRWVDRVRLQTIDTAGACNSGFARELTASIPLPGTPVERFAAAWDDIYRPPWAWVDNPWVWVCRVELTDPPEAP